ncbi:hypothetical protein [Catellatospora vulcania]|uniref:hypothetical protein n=1 Tax=Catellatospora vulcania TaxID=1460450 RepID=UPI0012D4441C|nr:hypothetical protein [Catellatospora vulcania]
MRTSRLARLVSRGAILAAVGIAAVGAAGPAFAADETTVMYQTDTTIEWGTASTIEWASIPTRDPDVKPDRTGLEEKTIEWA